jgi:hypothetical protein
MNPQIHKDEAIFNSTWSMQLIKAIRKRKRLGPREPLQKTQRAITNGANNESRIILRKKPNLFCSFEVLTTSGITCVSFNL